jgi:Transmembrane protein 43
MPDSFTSVTSESWLSRLVGSIVGVLFGLVLILASFPVLFWNEGRAVRTAKSLNEGAAEVVSVAPDQVVAANEGRLVYTSGQATTAETLTDSDFGVTTPAIRLVRKAEMFQWKEDRKSETRKKLGGGTETVTTYSYATEWSPAVIPSSGFHEAQGHQNPDSLPIAGANWTARAVTLGAFTLSPAQVAKLNQTEDVRAETRPSQTLPPNVKFNDGGFYRGADPAAPVVGDERITFEAVRPAAISVIGRQVGTTFEPDQSTAAPILLVTYGTVSADGMFKVAEANNRTLTWILRAAGFVAMLIGFALVFRPLVTVADVVPFIGAILGVGTFLAAFSLAMSLSLVTIGVAWIVFRPILGVALLAVAVGSIVAAHRMGVGKKGSKA